MAAGAGFASAMTLPLMDVLARLAPLPGDGPSSAATDPPAPVTATTPHRWVMVIDLRSCDGCGRCTQACQAGHYLDPQQEWIKVYQLQNAEGGTFFMPRPCMQCQDPPCLRVCPTGATFATADGLSGSNGEASGTGWWNVNGGDMKLLQAMLDKINAGLCIDQARIFSTGFSFGGMMSYTVPFQFDVFRAVAPCSGKTGVIPYDEKFTRPIPIMAFHGDSDTFVATALGKAFFDKFAARNKCGAQTQPVSPTGCVQYQGCEVPSIWCLFPGGHTTWSEEPQAIWTFFSQF